MKQPFQFFVLFTLGILVTACASDDGYRMGSEPDMSSKSSAPGWAYAADGFAVNKRQPVREKTAHEFYYKHCDLSDNLSFYSKTSYECAEPY